MIVDAQSKTWSVINTQLIQLYWSIGQYIFNKTTNNNWGKSTVEALVEYIYQHHLPVRGFSARNIWRMKQFYENYEDTKLSTVLTVFPTNTMGVFKDSYIFEFLELPENYLEHDLRKALNLKDENSMFHFRTYCQR